MNESFRSLIISSLLFSHSGRYTVTLLLLLLSLLLLLAITTASHHHCPYFYSNYQHYHNTRNHQSQLLLLLKHLLSLLLPTLPLPPTPQIPTTLQQLLQKSPLPLSCVFKESTESQHTKKKILISSITATSNLRHFIKHLERAVYLTYTSENVPDLNSTNGFTNWKCITATF